MTRLVTSFKLLIVGSAFVALGFATDSRIHEVAYNQSNIKFKVGRSHQDPLKNVEFSNSGDRRAPGDRCDTDDLIPCGQYEFCREGYCTRCDEYSCTNKQQTKQCGWGWFFCKCDYEEGSCDRDEVCYEEFCEPCSDIVCINDLVRTSCGYGVSRCANSFCSPDNTEGTCRNSEVCFKGGCEYCTTKSCIDPYILESCGNGRMSCVDPDPDEPDKPDPPAEDPSLAQDPSPAPSSSPEPKDDGGSGSTPVIIGAVCGGVAVIALVAGGVYYLRHKSAPNLPTSHPPGSFSTHPMVYHPQTGVPLPPPGAVGVQPGAYYAQDPSAPAQAIPVASAPIDQSNNYLPGKC